MSTEKKEDKVYNYILYILPLNNNEAFKVGITRNNMLYRIKNLNNIYKFNLKNAYLIYSNEKIIKSLERQLLTDYSSYKYYVENKSDGHSEFLKIDCLKYILQEIKFKSRLSHIELKIVNGIRFKNILVKRRTEIENIQKDYQWDFTEIDTFVSIVSQNINNLTYLEEDLSKNGIYVKSAKIFSKNKNLLKKLFMNRTYYKKNVHDFKDICVSGNILHYLSFNFKEKNGHIRIIKDYDENYDKNENIQIKQLYKTLNELFKKKKTQNG